MPDKILTPEQDLALVKLGVARIEIRVAGLEKEIQQERGDRRERDCEIKDALIRIDDKVQKILSNDTEKLERIARLEESQATMKKIIGAVGAGVLIPILLAILL